MPIYLLSPNASLDTVHLPMIEFTVLGNTIDFSRCDLLMFTSKQAVLSTEALNSDWKKVPCLAVGDATAKLIRNLGGIVAHQSKTYYVKDLGQDISSLFEDKNILYLRPKEIASDIKPFLHKEGIVLEEQIVYETSCLAYLQKDRPPKGSIIIFTSPSTIRCFFRSFSWDESYTAVVIGETTKGHLPENFKLYVADEPLIDACVAKAKEILTANRL